MKTTNYLLIAVLVVCVIGFGVQLRSQNPLGGTTNFNDLAVDTLTSTGLVTAGGLSNSSGTSIGSGTNIVKTSCGTATYNPPNLPGGATSSIEVSVAGATTTKNQVYWAGVNTTTFDIILSAGTNGTSGIVNVLFTNSASGTSEVAVNLTTTTVSACYLQF